MEAKFWTLKNKNGMSIKLFNYGATLNSVNVPDKNGKLADVVFGFDDLEGYEKFNDYFGSTVGRHAGRIGKGKFSIDGKKYQLATNNGENHLHGGLKGLDKVIWDAEEIKSNKGQAIKFSCSSLDGENNYPGNMFFTTIYTLTDNNEIIIDMYATTDKKTIVNMTNHAYFNLKGAGNESILDHYAKFEADFFLPGDEGLIPTGEVLSVKNTPLDFKKFKQIGRDIDSDHLSTKYGKGYDLAFVSGANGVDVKSLAKVYEESTGRMLEVFSNQPALIFYTGNWLKGNFKGKNGKSYPARSGFCLEPGAFPDSPNKPHFPKIYLNPNELYKNTIIYKFSIKR